MADFVINWDDEIKFERALSRISTVSYTHLTLPTKA